jgi:hypothetical protein
MICEHCYGKGERGSVCWIGTKICPECQGSGIVSCCDTAGASEPLSDFGYTPDDLAGSLEDDATKAWRTGSFTRTFTLDLNKPEDLATWRRLYMGDLDGNP